MNYYKVVLIALFFLMTPTVTAAVDLLTAAIGGVVTVTAATFALPALGFGAGGIAAGSVAAKAMSFAWTTGWGVGAVSTAQSLGALGLPAAAKVVAGAVGAVATKVIFK